MSNPYQRLTGGFISQGSPLITQYQYSTGLYKVEQPNAYAGVMGYAHPSNGDQYGRLGDRLRNVFSKSDDEMKDEALEQEEMTIRQLAGKSRECLELLGEGTEEWNMDTLQRCADMLRAGAQFKRENQDTIDKAKGLVKKKTPNINQGKGRGTSFPQTQNVKPRAPMPRQTNQGSSRPPYVPYIPPVVIPEEKEIPWGNVALITSSIVGFFLLARHQKWI